MDKDEAERRLHSIKDFAALIDSEADALLAMLEGEPHPEHPIVEPPDPAIEPPEPPNPGPGNPGEWIGGDVGSGKRVVFEGKVYTKTLKPAQANTDYYKCVFKTGDQSVIDNYKMPKNVRFLDCTFEGINTHLGVYLNNGHAEEEIGFVIQRAKIVRCKMDSFTEFKASLVYVCDCEVGEGTSLKQTIRQRHGKKLVCERNKGFSQISARGWLHYARDNPGADVCWWAGNLPSRYDDWKPMHKPGGGFNMQCSELCYAEGCGSVEVGHVQGEGAKKYPALNCMTHPDQRSVKLSHQDGYERKAVSSPAALWAMGR